VARTHAHAHTNADDVHLSAAVDSCCCGLPNSLSVCWRIAGTELEQTVSQADCCHVPAADEQRFLLSGVGTGPGKIGSS
jgi:hypothetical protein